MEHVLSVEQVSAAYGSIRALKEVSLHVDRGECVAIIGANGAGKSTLMKVISGLLPASSGTIRYEGSDITKWPTHKIVAAGIAQVPEGRQVFSELSVLDNLKMGAYQRKDDIQPEIDTAFQTFPILEKRMHQMAGSLSGGEQQMLAMSRALMSKPKLLLLDEPSMGLSPLLVKTVFDTVRRLHESGLSIVLVEQNARMALSVADRLYVLATGQIELEGNAEELQQDPRVRDIYLGI